MGKSRKISKYPNEGVFEAPSDGKQYARKDDGWEEVVSSGGGVGIPEPTTDGTWTRTKSGSTYLWSALPAGSGISEAPIDGLPYSRQDASWVLASISPTTATPILSGASTVNENTDLVITISNYSATATYGTPIVVTGTATRVGDTITMTASDVGSDTAGSVSLTAVEPNENISTAGVHSFTVLDVPLVDDGQLIYNAANMTEFTTLTNVELSDTDSRLHAITPIDTTNIVDTAILGSFDTITQVVDGDKVNVDGTDMIVSGVTYVNPNYTVPTPAVTATTAYINEHRALANVVTQDGGENDFIGTRLTSGVFEYPTLDNGTSSADTLVSDTKIEDGDNAVILLDDETTYVEFVVSGVTGTGPYTLDTTAQTAGEIPSRFFAVDAEPSFIIDGVNTPSSYTDAYSGGVNSLVDSADPFEDGSLKAKYQFDNDTLDTTTNYDGTASNLTYTSGRFGQSGVFNGTSSRVTLGTTLGDFGGGDFSISFWAKHQTLGDSIILFQVGRSGDANGCAIGTYSTTNIAFSLGQMSISKVTADSGTLNEDNAWHNYTSVRQGDNIYLYIDTVLAGSSSGASSYSVSSGYQTTIGCGEGTGGYSYFYSGAIDQLEIYSRALNQEEVTALYHSQSALSTTRTFADVLDSTGSQTIQTKVSLGTEGTKMSNLTTTLQKEA